MGRNRIFVVRRPVTGRAYFRKLLNTAVRGQHVVYKVMLLSVVKLTQKVKAEHHRQAPSTMAISHGQKF